MFLKKTIVLLFGLLMCSLVSAQENCALTFSGTVTSENGEALPGVVIILDSAKFITTTANDGRFTFRNICPGEHKVLVQLVGFKSQQFTFMVHENAIRTITLEYDVVELKEVVVQDQVLNTEHAQNYTTLSKKELEEASGKTLGEILKEVPGMNTVQSGPGIFKPVIHGVHSQRILILNYGIRQEGQQWGAEHAPEIDPFIASNITVIKDASSIKYGTDALGGVIVINPSPLPEQAGLGGSFNSVLQSNGRSGTFSGLLEGGIKNQKGWGWRIQGTGKRAGDFHAPDYSLTNTGVKELNFSTAAGFHDERKGVEIFFSHFNTEIGILKGTSIGNLDDLENAMESEPPQYTTDFSYEISEPRQEVSHNLLKLNGHIQTDHGEWRFQYGFQNNNRKEFDRRLGDNLSKKPAIDLRLNTHTVEVEFEKVKSGKMSTCMGFTGIIQDNDNIYGTDRIPFIPDFNNLSGGLFAISRRYYKNLTLDIGARYDYRYYDVAGYDYLNRLYHAKLQFHNASATIGSTWRLPRNQQLSVNLSSAWRPPHVAELYSLGTHQSAAAIEYGLLLNDSTNEVMDINETSFEVEQALKSVATYQKNWEKFQLEISGYANYIFNYIYLRPTGVTVNVRGAFPYFRYTQTNALFLGADFSGVWQLNSKWKITSKASLLRASDETNNDYLIFIPSNRYEIEARYEFPNRSTRTNFYIESRAKFVSRQHRAPRVITVAQFNEAIENDIDLFEEDNSNFDFMDAPDGYMLWDVVAGFSVRTEKGRYDFRVASENLLNTEYREYTNRFRYYADDMGRNFLFSFKYTF